MADGGLNIPGFGLFWGYACVCVYIYFFGGQPSLTKSALAVSFKGVGLLSGGCPSSKRSKQEPLLKKKKKPHLAGGQGGKKWGTDT